jgi:trans-aconitate 2-methyltransferase
MSTWRPEQYLKFKDERSQPFFDLLALVKPVNAMRAVDLGCGSGELTRELHARLGAESTLGLDSSESMLEKAAAIVEPGLRFERASIEEYAPDRGSLDLVFSNAALHWVEDHPRLLERLASFLAPSGQIAVQMPSNQDHVSHVVAAEVAGEEPFKSALAGHVRVFPNLSLDAYARLLHRLGFAEQHVRMQVYPHRLGAKTDVIEWVKGTLLTDYQKRMPADLWPSYLERYRAALLPRLPDEQPFFYPFKRILFWAQK